MYRDHTSAMTSLLNAMSTVDKCASWLGFFSSPPLMFLWTPLRIICEIFVESRNYVFDLRIIPENDVYLVCQMSNSGTLPLACISLPCRHTLKPKPTDIRNGAQNILCSGIRSTYFSSYFGSQ